MRGTRNYSPCHIFCMISEEKYSFCYIVLTDQISLSGCLYLVGQYVYVIICWPGCDAINFEINIILLIKPFLRHNQNVKTAANVPREQRNLSRWNKKHFSSVRGNNFTIHHRNVQKFAIEMYKLKYKTAQNLCVSCSKKLNTHIIHRVIIHGGNM